MEGDDNRPRHDYFTRASAGRRLQQQPAQNGDAPEGEEQPRAIRGRHYDAAALQQHAQQHRVQLDGEPLQGDPNRVRSAEDDFQDAQDTLDEEGLQLDQQPELDQEQVPPQQQEDEVFQPEQPQNTAANDLVRNTRLQRLINDRPGPDEARFDAFANYNREVRGQTFYNSTWQSEYQQDASASMPQWDTIQDRPEQRPLIDPNRLQLGAIGDAVQKNTRHGQYLQGLLGTYEDQERVYLKYNPPLESRANRGPPPGDTSRLTRAPSNASLSNSGPPPLFPLSSDKDHAVEEAFRKIESENFQLRRQLAALKNQQQPPRNYNQHNNAHPSNGDGYGYNQAAPPYRPPFEQRKNIKLPKFTGKNFHAFKSAFIRCAKLLKYDEEEAQTQLICCCNDSAQNYLSKLPVNTPVVQMLSALEFRYGANQSIPDVQNQLMEIKRKPNEDLYSLYDRIMSTVRKADLPEWKRGQLAREHFFLALRSNRKQQHFVARNDHVQPPNIDVTLALALQWEMDNGRETASSGASVRQVEETTETECSEDTDLSEQINKLTFHKTKHIKDPDLRKFGQQQNEILELIKKQQQLLHQAFLPSSGATSSRSSTRTSTSSSAKPPSTATSGRSKSTSSAQSSKKPWQSWNKKKGTGKPHSGKPTNKINECDDEAVEDEPAEDDCYEEEQDVHDEQE